MNHYWNVYINLEKDLIESSRFVNFDENQFGVYSDKFVDILLRACSEIESLSKDLFELSGGTYDKSERRIKFDENCLSYLNKVLEIDKKEVLVERLVETKSKKTFSLFPLKDANLLGKDKGPPWKEAYQSIKHNRNKYFEIKMAEISLIHSQKEIFLLLELHYLLMLAE